MLRERGSPPPRIAPLESSAGLPASTAALLDRCTQRSGLSSTPTIFGTLAHHPALFERLLGAGLGSMPDARLPVPHRELLILRTARNCAAEYEWVHHVRHATERGLTADAVMLARDGTVPAQASVQAALVDAADDLHRDATVSDEVWGRLEHYLDRDQILEVLVVVGYFRIFAHLLNACRVQLEPAVAARYPQPWPTEPELNS